MRLFVAIDCEPVEFHLKKIQKSLHPLRGRFTDDFHLTLKFIGNVDDSKLESVINRLSKIELPSFELCLNHLGMFNTYNQQIIWCGIEKSNPLLELQSSVNQVLQDILSEPYKFTPHITLLRIKKVLPETKEVVKEVLKKEFQPVLLKVREFKLFKSQLKSGPPKYLVRARFPLS